MKTNETDDGSLRLETLVRTHLKLDPESLARLGASASSRRTVEASLHEFMRRVLQRAVSFLWLPADAMIRLRSAEVAGWPDAKTFNLAELLAWALIREPRRLRGLPAMPLLPPDPASAGLVSHDDRPQEPVSTLVKMATVLFEADFDQIRDAPGPDANQPVSVGTLMRDMLSVSPERLIIPYHDTEAHAREAYARDPEGQIVARLSAMLTKVVYNYPTVSAAQTPETDGIAFLIGDGGPAKDYGEGTAEVDLGALLMAGLLADGKKEIVFFR